MELLAAGDLFLISGNIDLSCVDISSVDPFRRLYFFIGAQVHLITHYFFVGEVVGIVGYDVGFWEVLVIGDCFVGCIVLLLNMILFYVVLVVLFRLAAGHEPDGDDNVEGNDNQQVDRKHEKIISSYFIINGYGTGGNRKDIQNKAGDAEIVHRGQLATYVDVNLGLRE